jgi:hypothetical protein
MRPKRLELRGSGSGLQIHGDIPAPIDFPEGTMKARFQGMLVACAPWIQFPNSEWDDMLGEVFQEMVDLWNEKNDARIAAEAIIESDEYEHPADSLADTADAAKHTAAELSSAAGWLVRAADDKEEYAAACKSLTKYLDKAKKTFLVAEAAAKIALEAQVRI